MIENARERECIWQRMLLRKCDDAENKVNEGKDQIKILLMGKRNIEGGTSSSGRRRQLTSAVINVDNLEKINEKIIDAKSILTY